MIPALDGPHQGRGGEHAVERADIGAMGEQHAHRVRVAAHGSAMQRRDVVLVAGVRVETRRQHRLERGAVAAFGGPMQQQVVLWPQIAAQGRLSLEHGRGGRAVAARAGGDESIERR